MAFLPASLLCNQAQCESAEYAGWCAQIGWPAAVHRKQWEWVYIASALDTLGLLAPGMRGLGFGVAREPLPALFAHYGVDVLATDLPADSDKLGLWKPHGMHAATLDELRYEGICSRDEFEQRIRFAAVDMRAVPAELRRGDFDFTWSSSSLDHLGSLQAGLAFIRASLECVRPGGAVVHTTEYNVQSNDKTLDYGDIVVYRQRDLEGFVAEMQQAGHAVTLDLSRGTREYDTHVAHAPYADLHLCMELAGYVFTSVGLCIVKGAA